MKRNNRTSQHEGSSHRTFVPRIYHRRELEELKKKKHKKKWWWYGDFLPLAVDTCLAAIELVASWVFPFRWSGRGWWVLRGSSSRSRRIRSLYRSRSLSSACSGSPSRHGAPRAVCRRFYSDRRLSAVTRPCALCTWAIWYRVCLFPRSTHHNADPGRTLGLWATIGRFWVSFDEVDRSPCRDFSLDSRRSKFPTRRSMLAQSMVTTREAIEVTVRWISMKMTSSLRCSAASCSVSGSCDCSYCSRYLRSAATVSSKEFLQSGWREVENWPCWKDGDFLWQNTNNVI